MVKQKETHMKKYSVAITGVEEKNGIVSIFGTAENLGLRKVEIIINSDLSKRCVAENNDDGTWRAEIKVNSNGDYTIEASIRDYSDFNKLRQTTDNDNYFMLDGSNVWGATVTRHTDGLYYMLFATWDTHISFSPDWFYFSEIGCAAATRLEGPYIYQGKALDASYCNTTHAEPVRWNWSGAEAVLNVFHNPTVMKSEKDGRYYLYFMGTSRDDMEKSHRRSRVGAAYADSPAGPWTIMDDFLLGELSLEAGDWESGFTANPSVTEIRREDGSYFYYALYKAAGVYEGQSICATGYGISDSPLGPFKRSKAPIMRDIKVGFSVEDCYIWHNAGKYYALAKDMTKGNWTGVTDGYSYALFESPDENSWALSENRLAFRNEIPWEKGVQKVLYYERSQLYLEDGIPFMLLNATTVSGLSPYQNHQPYNVRVPLLGEVLASCTCPLTVSDLVEYSVDKSELIRLLHEAEIMNYEKLNREEWKKLKSAVSAARVVNAREHAEQADVDFVVSALKKSILDTQY